MQIVPFSTFAFEETINSTLPEMLTDNVSEETPNIVCEVVEKRDEFTKVYQMEDGSFYELNYFMPVHELVNGEWIDIIETSENSINTIEEAISTTIQDPISQESSTTTFSLQSNVITESNSENCIIAAFSKNSDGDYVKSTSNRIDYDSAFVMVKPKSLKTTPGINCVVVSAKIRFYSAPIYSDISDNYIIANEAALSWDENTTSYDPDDVDYTTLDLVNVCSRGNYTWDITEAYSRWERDKRENNGVVLTAYDEGGINVSRGLFIIQYREISPTDDDLTYQSIDMGRAGTVYVNEFTNEISVIRDDIGLYGENMPVEISSIYSHNNAEAITGEGYNWNINYSSSLRKIGEKFWWNSVEDGLIEFVKTSEIDNGRNKWVEKSNQYLLWVNEEKTNDEYDFSENTIIKIEDGTEYVFETGDGTSALLCQIAHGSNSIDLEYNFEFTRLNSVVDGVGRRFIFVYDDNEHLIKIEARKSTSENEIISIPTVSESNETVSVPIQIQYNYTTINDKSLLTSVTYSDGETVYYDYDDDGNLIYIKNIDETEFVVTEEEEGKLYSKRKATSSNSYQPLKWIRIEDKNAYQREISHNDETYERILYSDELYCQYYRNYTMSDGQEIVLSEYYYDDSEGSNVFIPSNDDLNEYIQNENFETRSGTTKAAYWTNTYGDVKRTTSSDVKPFDCGKGELKIEGDPSDVAYAYQEVEVEDLNDGDVIAISGLGKAFESVYGDSHFFGIKVFAVYGENIEEEVCSLTFDNSLENVWQYRIDTFNVDLSNAENTLTKFKIVCSYNNQFGEARFDGLKMYKTENIYSSVLEPCVCGENCAYGLGCTCDCESESVCECDECKVDFCACGTECLYGANCPCECESVELCECVSCHTETSVDYNTDHVIRYYTTDGNRTKENYTIYTEDDNYILKTIDENGLEVMYDYDNETGLLNSITDSNGETIYNYNAMGVLSGVSRVISSSTDNIIHSTQYGYSDDRISYVEHNGFKYNFFYNASGECISVKVENSPFEMYDYENGDLSSIVYANGDAINYRYENGKILSISYDNNVTYTYEYEYDENGKVTKVIDRKSGLTTEYNCSREVVGDNGTETVEITYDVITYRTSNPSDIRYSITENEDGSTTENFAGTKFTTYNYDTTCDEKTGITINATNIKYATGEMTYAFSTDVFGRTVPVSKDSLIESDYNDSETASKYVEEKNSIGLVVSKNETSYYYNDSNENIGTQVTGFHQKISQINNTPYSYIDKLHNINGYWQEREEDYYITYNNNGDVWFVYAFDGEAVGNLLYKYEYNDLNQVIREDYSGNGSGNSYTYTYEYDSNGKITEEHRYNYTPGPLGNRISTRHFVFNEAEQRYYEYNRSSYWENEYSYEYDGNGNITHIYSGIDESTRTLKNRYTYDDADQLIREDKNATGTYTYTYDQGGNITSKSEYGYTLGEIPETPLNTINYTYDNVWKDKLISYDGQTITYDSLGNPLTVGDKDGTQEAFAYSWEGRQLVECKVYNSQGTIGNNYKYVFEYDANGYRTSKTKYDITIDSNGNETLGTGNRTEFVWVNGKLEYQYVAVDEDGATLAIKYLYDENGEPFGFIADGVDVFHYTKNLQGDITGVCAANEGTSMVSYNYDAWGNVTLSLNTSSGIEALLGSMLVASNNIFTYRGYIYDLDIGLFYLHSRYYQPEWGRFLNSDNTETLKTTIGELHGANLFAYCNNNPINRVDPYGTTSYKFRISESNQGHNVTVDITAASRNKYTGYYTLNTNGVAQVDCKSSSLKKIINKSLTDTFSEAILKSSRSLISNCLAGRTARGIEFEILAHYFLNSSTFKSAEIANIGSSIKGAKGYDENAWIFEDIQNIQFYNAIFRVAPTQVLSAVIKSSLGKYF